MPDSRYASSFLSYYLKFIYGSTIIWLDTIKQKEILLRFYLVYYLLSLISVANSFFSFDKQAETAVLWYSRVVYKLKDMDCLILCLFNVVEALLSQPQSHLIDLSAKDGGPPILSRISCNACW